MLRMCLTWNDGYPKRRSRNVLRDLSVRLWFVAFGTGSSHHACIIVCWGVERRRDNYGEEHVCVSCREGVCGHILRSRPYRVFQACLKKRLHYWFWFRLKMPTPLVLLQFSGVPELVLLCLYRLLDHGIYCQALVKHAFGNARPKQYRSWLETFRIRGNMICILRGFRIIALTKKICFFFQKDFISPDNIDYGSTSAGVFFRGLFVFSAVSSSV